MVKAMLISYALLSLKIRTSCGIVLDVASAPAIKPSSSTELNASPLFPSLSPASGYTARLGRY